MVEGTLQPADTALIASMWAETWGTPVVSIDRTYTPGDVEGLAYRDEDGQVQGLITWSAQEARAEIVTVDARQTGRHIGGRLLSGAEEELERRGVKNVTIVTTNDNLRALTFYVRRGYRLMRVHLDAMHRVREVKPAVPKEGNEGIPLQDMLELEKRL
jgi:GNAT superfamily N-acetyltransferase